MSVGRPVGVTTTTGRSARRHGEAVEYARQPHRHVRLRRVVVRPQRRRALRPRWRTARRPRRAPIFNSDVLDAARSDIAGKRVPTIRRLRSMPSATSRGSGVDRDAALVAIRFGRTSTTSPVGQTPQPMGFKDGTNNLTSDETSELDRHVWVGSTDGPAMTNGCTSWCVVSACCSRCGTARRSVIESRRSGAPGGWRAAVEATNTNPSISPTPGRRAVDSGRRTRATGGTGDERRRHAPAAWLLVRRRDRSVRKARSMPVSSSLRTNDPRTGFIPAERLARAALNEYIRHETSVYAVPQGVRPGGYIEETVRRSRNVRTPATEAIEPALPERLRVALRHLPINQQPGVPEVPHWSDRLAMGTWMQTVAQGLLVSLNGRQPRSDRVVQVAPMALLSPTPGCGPTASTRHDAARHRRGCRRKPGAQVARRERPGHAADRVRHGVRARGRRRGPVPAQRRSWPKWWESTRQR